MTQSIVRPNGNGATAQWAAVGAATVWEAVNEAVADDDTSYAEETGSSGTHFLTMDAFSITSSAIAFLRHFTRMRVTLGSVNINQRIIVNGTQYSGGTPTLTSTTYIDQTADFLTNPDTGSAWLEADIEGTGSNPLQDMVLRVTGIAGGETVRCTQAYLLVDFTAAGGVSIPVIMNHLRNQGIS